MKRHIVVLSAVLCVSWVFTTSIHADPPTPTVNANIINTPNVTVTNPTSQPVPVAGTKGISSSSSAPVNVTGNVSISRVPYQQTVMFTGSNTQTCPDNDFCLVSFYQVPTGKLLVVEAITALIFTPGRPSVLAFGEVASINAGNIAIVAPDFVESSFLGSTLWMIDRQVRVYYAAGMTPRVKIFGSRAFGPGYHNISLHGYPIDESN